MCTSMMAHTRRAVRQLKKHLISYQKLSESNPVGRARLSKTYDNPLPVNNGFAL